MHTFSLLLMICVLPPLFVSSTPEEGAATVELLLLLIRPDVLRLALDEEAF